MLIFTQLCLRVQFWYFIFSLSSLFSVLFFAGFMRLSDPNATRTGRKQSIENFIFHQGMREPCQVLAIPRNSSPGSRFRKNDRKRIILVPNSRLKICPVVWTSISHVVLYDLLICRYVCAICSHCTQLVCVCVCVCVPAVNTPSHLFVRSNL